jgi:hypothetical protein
MKIMKMKMKIINNGNNQWRKRKRMARRNEEMSYENENIIEIMKIMA